MKIAFRINGEIRSFEVAPDDRLADLLRRAGWTGVKKGCATGVCGACTVLLDGRPVVACQVFSAKADGCAVTTIEGLAGPDGAPHPLQRLFAEHGAVQCGFCIPGMILSAYAFIESCPGVPTDDQIRDALAGNICRCTGYVRQVAAVREAVRVLKVGGAA